VRTRAETEKDQRPWCSVRISSRGKKTKQSSSLKGFKDVEFSTGQPGQIREKKQGGIGNQTADTLLNPCGKNKAKKQYVPRRGKVGREVEVPSNNLMLKKREKATQ